MLPWPSSVLPGHCAFLTRLFCQSELDDTRRAVSNAAHNFAMLKQSLEDQLAQDNKALEKAKAYQLVANSGGGEMASLEASQAASKNSCARMASDHEASVESLANELKALADATQVLQSETGGADGQTYSLFQESAVACLHTSSDLKGG